MNDLVGRIAELSPEKRELLALVLEREGEKYNIFPLSFAQQRLWVLAQLTPAAAAYCLPAALTLAGPLAYAALAAALAALVARHESLRTAFPLLADQPVQHIGPPVAPALPVIDLSGLSTPQAASAQDALDQALVRWQFDLARGPLLVAALVRRAPDQHGLLLSLHHLVADGWSLSVLLADLAALYQAYAAQTPPTLPSLPLQYADWSLWQRQALTPARHAQLLAVWERQMAGCPPLALPTDAPRPPHAPLPAASFHLTLPPALVAALDRLGRRLHTTRFMTLLAAWAVVLGGWSGQDDLIIGTPVAQRDAPALAGLVGCCLNLLPLRVRLDGDPTGAALLDQVRAVCLAAYAHQALPFEHLVAALAPARDLRHPPLIQTLLVLEPPLPQPDFGGLDVTWTPLDPPAAKYDLTLLLRDDGAGGLAAQFEYAAPLFAPATLARVAARWVYVLERLVADPTQRVGALGLPPDEQAQVAAWQGPAWPIPPTTLWDAVVAQAARTPERVALVADDTQLTYAGLVGRAAALGQQVQARGGGPETRVGVALARDGRLLVGVLAVLAAGGAYVPLDARAPQARLAHQIADAAVALVLATPEQVAHLPPLHNDQLLLVDGARHAHAPPHPCPAGPAHLAYVLYTSGSTGVPKGVALTHHNALALLTWAHATFPPAVWSGVLAATALSFDLSVFELFAPLTCGGTLVLAADALALPEVAHQGVRLLNTVPSALAELLRLGPLPTSVQVVCLAGEALPRALVAQLYAQPHLQAVYNLYGPTEAATYTTAYCVPRDETGAVPIGAPIANTTAYVLDGAGQPAPLGAVGELYLGGPSVARGYLARPDLTAERFTPNPFRTHSRPINDSVLRSPSSVLYRTGDRARWRADGVLEYWGRGDGQVKLRGFRVELGEVEAALRGHPAVQAAVVVVRATEAGEVRLVAYVVPTADDRRRTNDHDRSVALRQQLAARLPSYMLPSAFVVLDALPLTPNGKIDRKALPAPQFDTSHAPADGAFRSAEEEQVAQVWAQVLGQSIPSRDTSFFALGGHSLSATQVVGRLRALFGVELPLRALFETPTVAGLAAAIRAARQTEADALPPLAPQPRPPVLPLSFAQQRLWVLAQLDPHSPAYTMALAVNMRGTLHIPALTAAFSTLIARHESLRTVFPLQGEQPVQQVLPPTAPALPLIDLAGLPPSSNTRVLDGLIDAANRQWFDLARGPLMRIWLVRSAPNQHVLLLAMHHLISDGWSLGVLLDDLTQLYQAARDHAPPKLAPLPVQYADFALWQRQALDADRQTRLLAYWQRQMDGCPPLDLPTDRPRAPGGTFCAGVCTVSLPSQQLANLHALSRREGATLFMTLMSAFFALLHAHSRQNDIVVGTDIAQRTQPAAEPLIGFFVNMLALRARLQPDQSTRELLQQVQQTCLAAYAHQDLPFEVLVDRIQPVRDPSRTPIFQVVFVLQNTPMPAVMLDELTLEPLPVAAGAAKFDLVVTLRETEGRIDGVWTYNTDLFDAATIERMARQFTVLLSLMTQDAERPLHLLIERLRETEHEQQLANAQTLRESQRQRVKQTRRKLIPG